MQKNIFKKLKEELKNKDVVEFYLKSEPVKVSGLTFYYESPFRNGANSNEGLAVNDRYIIDYGGEFKGDIIKFVAEFKGITLMEAVKLLIKDFNLDTKVNLSNDLEVKENAYNKTLKEITLEEGATTDNIITMFDTVPFKTKPTGKETGQIKERIKNLEVQNYSLEQIQTGIIRGYTCIPRSNKK